MTPSQLMDSKSRLSSIALVIANLVPLVGVLVFGWRVFDVLMLYWLENVVIGVINVMRMALVPGRSKGFMMVFFTVHYGVFCFGHLTAIVGLFGATLGVAGAWEYFFTAPDSGTLAENWQTAQWLAIGCIAASHLFSYFGNFIGGGEYRRTTAGDLMKRPYGRIVVLHVAIIFGAALIQWLGSPVSMLVVLVAAKILLDLRLHLAERDQFRTPAS
ncbi:MAG: DUF6498-containing protein [Woeseiaceae bacterium]